MVSQEQELYGGRPLIQPDSEILGGVLQGSQCGYYVDLAENSEPYERLYETLDQTLETGLSAGDQHPEIVLAEAVRSVVMRQMQFAPGVVGQILKQAAQERGKPKERLDMSDMVELSEFIPARGANCDILTLMCGVMYRLTQQRRSVGGAVSVDPAYSEFRIHHWLRRTTDEIDPENDSNKLIIVDCFFGQDGDSYVGWLPDSIKVAGYRFFRGEDLKRLGL